MAAQPVPDGVPVDAQLVGDLDELPPLPGDAINEAGLQAGKAEVLCTDGETLVGGPAA